MIDFKNPSFVKLSPINPDKAHKAVYEMLVSGEEIFQAFKGIRDQVVFTNKRAIAINVQGITGKKVDYTSLPFSKVQAFSIETSGVMDIDCELDLWFSSLGNVRFEFSAGFDIRGFSAILSHYVLE